MAGVLAPRRRPRWWLWAAIAVAVLLLAAAGWLAVRGLQAKSDLEALAPLADDLSAAIASGDMDGAEHALTDVRTHAQSAAELTGDPLWRLTEGLPLVGANTAAVRVAAGALAQVSTAALPVTAALREQPDAAATAVDVTAVTALQKPLAELAHSLTGDVDDLLATDAESLISPLDEGVRRLQDAVGRARGAVVGAAEAARIAPGMLGADGARSILLVLQNPAELRSGGGLTGGFALLTAADGGVTLTDQADSSEFRPAATPLRAVPETTTALYGDVVGRYVQNFTMTPDFSLSAQLASDWWEVRTGHRPDSVLSIDTVVLRSLLTVTGPVALSDGRELGADNFVDIMLVEPYLTLDGAAQTRLQQEATAAVFARVLAGGIDTVSLVRALAKPVEEGRVSLWSAHEQEQSVLATGPLAGAEARHRDAGPGAYAVYFNDATKAKLGTFLDAAVRAGTDVCRSDGRRDVVIEVTLASRAPADAAAMPASMTGPADDDIPAGDIMTAVSVAAPPGADYGGVWSGDTPVLSAEAVDGGFPTSVARIGLAPGQSATLQFRFVAPAGADAGSPVVLTTPMIAEASVGTLDVSPCG